jgi:DnaJ like chaperone protein
MSIWGQIRDALASIGESVGAFLQELARAKPKPPEKTLGFTIGMIALGAKMAKADGVVTGAEVAAFKRVFRVPESELAAVARVYNLAKQDVAGYELYAKQVARLFARKSPILEDVLDGLFHIALADSTLHPSERIFLSNVASIFGFSEDEFARISARFVKAGPDDPYVTLGLVRTASVDEIKLRYRKLAREHHPDRHIAAGVPQEMVALATERLARINAAYETIMKARAA